MSDMGKLDPVYFFLNRANIGEQITLLPDTDEKAGTIRTRQWVSQRVQNLCQNQLS